MRVAAETTARRMATTHRCVHALVASGSSNLTNASSHSSFINPFHQSRGFAKINSPGSDPLELLRSECFERSLCDESGFRLPGVHWVFHLATPSKDNTQAPNLRTVGVQRVSEDGVDFVVKSGASHAYPSSPDSSPLSFLHSQGKYAPGQQAEQWRADGHVERLALDEVLHKVPHYTITGMVASRRISNELAKAPEDRVTVKDKSHLTEIMQHTRIELENGDISREELADSIVALRFQPDRIERMVGGPDAVLWDRWEWERSEAGDCPEGKIAWNEPKWLLPH